MDKGEKYFGKGRGGGEWGADGDMGNIKGQMEHMGNIKGKRATYKDGAQAAGARLLLHGLAGGSVQRLLREDEVNVLHVKQRLVLRHQRILWLGQNIHHRLLIKCLLKQTGR